MLRDDHLLLILSASPQPLDFQLPQVPFCKEWELLVDTSKDDAQESCPCGAQTHLPPRSLKLFRCRIES
jgi:glycogen operon protein